MTNHYNKQFEIYDSLVFYKVLTIEGFSPFQAYYKYKIGENFSNRQNIELTDLEICTENIFYGIHVFQHRDNAIYYVSRAIGYGISLLIIPVNCKKEHFIAAGTIDAAFTQVEIDEYEYNKVFGKKLCVTVSVRDKLGTDLSSRWCAAKFRTEIVDLIKAGRTQVTLDLEGVCTASESFADELFGILVKQNGEEWFRKHIILRGVSSEVRYSILSAIEHRIAMN